MTTWSEERISNLRQWWADGLSAGEIARRFNNAVHFRLLSRNAVIGKVHRLGLSGRVNPSKSGLPRKPRLYALKALFERRASPSVYISRLELAALAPLGPAIEEARANQCRYIRDEPGSPICGRPTLNGSWCAQHRAVVFTCVKIEAAAMAEAA